MILLVDVGNSRIKWALGETPGQWRAQGASARGDESALGDAWRDLQPGAVVASNVAGPRAAGALADLVRKLFDLEVRFEHARAAGYGVSNHYAQPSRLGADRWAALVGARAFVSGPVCVVDCGTAITVDGLDDSGRFHGGVIFPGLELCASALGSGTHDIGTAAGSGQSFPGRDTADAVACGVRYGVAAAIEGLVARYCEFLGGEPVVLVTGGDAAGLLPLVQRPVQAVPDLVLRGLAVMAAKPA